MNFLSVFLILVFNSTLVKTNTYFRRSGFIVKNPSYAHVHMQIDLTNLQNQIKDIDSAILHFHKLEKFNNHSHIKLRANTFLKHSYKQIQQMHVEYSDFSQLLKGPMDTSKRSKRFLGMVLAITSLTLSLFNTAQILQLKLSLDDVVTRQNHIADILQSHENAIHSLRHDVTKLRDNFITTINIIEEQAALLHLFDFELQLSQAMEELQATLNCLRFGTERLFSHRLPSCFLNTTSIEQTHTRLTLQAARKGLIPVSQSSSSYLQYEVSFIIQNSQLHIFVHVPLMDMTQNLEILQFFPIPIPVTSTIHLQIIPPDLHLIISKDGSHATIATHTLDHCLSYSDFYFCDKPIILSKSLSSSCLGAIYAQNFTNLENKCPVTFHFASEIVSALSAGEILIYSSKPQTIQVSCPSGMKHIAIHLQHIFTFNPGCHVVTSEHQFTIGFDLTINDDIQRWPTIWNVSDSVFGLNSDSLDKVIKDLHLIDSAPTSLRDIKRLISNQTHSKINIIATIFCIIIFIFLIFIFSFLLYRYCIMKRVQNNNQNE